MRRKLLAIMVLLLGTACGSPSEGSSSPPTAPLSVAAASSLRPVLEELAGTFQSRGDMPLSMTYGASGSLHTQLKHGAPFNIYLPASTLYLADLPTEMPRIDTLAFGSLGLLSQKPDLASCKSLCIPDPKVAPYGAAARKYLDQMGYTGQIYLATNAAQVVHQVQNGWADGGLTAWTLLRSLPGARPIKNAPQVPILGVVVAQHPHSDDFMELLRNSPEIWKKHGYDLPVDLPVSE